MIIQNQELEHRLDHLTQVCRAAGLKVTHQRLEIFREVAGRDDHPNAENIFSSIRERLPTVSLDTVYRTLWLLVDLGLIDMMGPGKGRTRFDANLDQHHHFVCIKCGSTKDFYNDRFDDLIQPEAINEFGSPQRTHVEVRGLCHKCNNETNE